MESTTYNRGKIRGKYLWRKIRGCSEYDPSTDRVKNRTIRAILKYRNHPSILAIREQKKAQINFCFKEVAVEETQKEVLNLNNKKASQNSDIPTKIIKENS